MEKTFDDIMTPGGVVDVASEQLLTAYLTSFDLNDVNKEITRMTGGEVN